MLSIPTLVVGLYICIFVFGALLFGKAFSSRNRVEIRWLLIFIGVICLISFCSLNVFIQDDVSQKAFFSRLRFLGFSIMGQTWFAFLLYTYGRSPKLLVNKILNIIVLIPALVTWALVLVPEWNDFFTKDYELFLWEGTRLVRWSAGPWFKFHIGTTYMVVLIGVVRSLLELRTAESWKKKQIIFLAVGGISSVTLDFFLVVADSPLRWVMLPGAMYVALEGLILYSIIKHGLLDLLVIAKDQVFHQMPAPLIILDQNRRILEFNDSAARIFHLSSTTLNRFFYDEKNLLGLDLNKTTQEFQLFDPSWGMRFFQVVEEPIQSHGIIAGKILLFHEITAQKKMEQNISNNLEFKARLLSMIAHDFSGVLQAQSQLSSTLEKNVGPELKKQASALAESTFSSQDFMTNVLQWARTQETKFQPVCRPYVMNVLLKEVVNNLESVWQSRDLKIDIELNAESLILNGDCVMIESVIRNILTNAIRASAPGQKIEIKLIKNSSKSVQIVIKDEGVGISAKHLEIIRRSTTAGFADAEIRPQGFGLGLAIAQRFIDLHYGLLEFQSKEGGGTSVMVTLPA